ncbi:hypothetical protein WJX77_000495 [Trebouxia sp. C0004]
MQRCAFSKESRALLSSSHLPTKELAAGKGVITFTFTGVLGWSPWFKKNGVLRSPIPSIVHSILTARQPHIPVNRLQAGAAHAADAPGAGPGPVVTGRGPGCKWHSKSGEDLAAMIGEAIDRVFTAQAATSSGVSPAPRQRVAVPEAIASLGISADEYEQQPTCQEVSS